MLGKPYALDIKLSLKYPTDLQPEQEALPRKLNKPVDFLYQTWFRLNVADPQMSRSASLHGGKPDTLHEDAVIRTTLKHSATKFSLGNGADERS